MGLDMYLYQLKKVDEKDDINDIAKAFEYYGYFDGREIPEENNDSIDQDDYFNYTGKDYEDLDLDIINKYKNHTLDNGGGSLIDEVIYWRKANAIHEFLIEHSIGYNKKLHIVI